MRSDEELLADIEAEIEAKRKCEARELRDRFAMAALTGILAARPPTVVFPYKKVAERAYGLADEMMKAREE